MNTEARALGMYQTSFADSSGLSPRNISTAADLAILGRYLYERKRFLLDISLVERMTVTSSDGTSWRMVNQNKMASDARFRGGKLGYTDEAQQTSLGLFAVPVGTEVRLLSVVVLGSQDWKQDTRTLLAWFDENVVRVR
jgi:D-alanyl-D-alanine endopeptidase (penicillin-binding protein 7)